MGKITVPLASDSGAFPATDEDPSVQTGGNIPLHGENPRPLRFLVADDSGVNRRVAAVQLEHLGHTVETATDGEEAVAMLARAAFDCVLMDVHMPGTDGLEATRRIREHERHTGRHISILAMTADGLAEDQEHCRAAGMDDCVAKPLDPHEAIATARRVISGIQASRAEHAEPPPSTAPVQVHLARTGRMSAVELRRQQQAVASTPGVTDVLDRLPQPSLLIGSYRQIVYANPAASQMMDATALAPIIGHRPGEALGCKHSTETAGGCGTTKFCANCGAAKVLRAGQRREHASDECRIVSATPGEDLDLRVWAAPLTLSGEPFTLFTVVDISDEKRRQVLEQVFLHDVLNTAGGIQGMTALSKDATAAERLELSEAVSRMTRTLIDELRAQQGLAAAEDGELQVKRQELSSISVIEDTVEKCRAHEVGDGRTLKIAGGCADVYFMSDETLLGRVLGNMTKNALEACPKGGTVTLDCRADGHQVEFSVHNPTAMPRDVQLQVFQRSFSTKGRGRGLGTYSMRLLTERYLDGTVSFSSSVEAGTTFIARFPATPLL